MTQNQSILEEYGPREAMEYDVVVVGGGPGGLAHAEPAAGDSGGSGDDQGERASA